MRSAVFLISMASLVVVTSACKKSASSKADPTSTVQGQLTTSSFAAAPTGVDAMDETGARTHATLAGDGAFRLDLVKGHVYTLVVVGAKGDEPMVFPRTGGRLDRTFRVSSGAGVVTLGRVRHFDRAPEGGFVVQSASSQGGGVKPATTGGDGEVGECVDGQIKGTGAPCVDDHEKATCEAGPEASNGDGECDNGKDAKTGQPCSDTDQVGENEQDADASQPMAVPDKNPPDDVGGCKDNGGEQDADNVEQEGEHTDPGDPPGSP